MFSVLFKIKFPSLLLYWIFELVGIVVVTTKVGVGACAEIDNVVLNVLLGYALTRVEGRVLDINESCKCSENVIFTSHCL